MSGSGYWPNLSIALVMLALLNCGGCAGSEYQQQEYRAVWWCLGFCGRVVEDDNKQAKGGAPDPFEVDVTSSVSRERPEPPGGHPQ